MHHPLGRHSSAEHVFMLESSSIARELFHHFLGPRETVLKEKMLYHSATQATQIWLSVVCEKYAQRCEKKKIYYFLNVSLVCTCD